MIFKRELGIGWTIVSLIVGGLIWEVTRSAFNPIPYRNVDVFEAAIRDGIFYLKANFEKNECEFVRLSAIGIGLDGQEVLRWRDMDDLPSDHDRSVGVQTLRIAVDLADQDFDKLEIRTRHNCGSDENPRFVNQVFMEYTL